MAFTFTSGPHYTVQKQFPPNTYRQINTGTWGDGGNTCVITDPGIKPNSDVVVWVTGTVPAAGTSWAKTIAAGTCTLTSTDAESSTLPVSYYVN